MPVLHRGLATAALVAGVSLTAVLPQELPPAVSPRTHASTVTPVALQLGIHSPQGDGGSADRFSAWSSSRVDRVAQQLPPGPLRPAHIQHLLAPYVGATFRLELTLHPIATEGDLRVVGERLVAAGFAAAELRLVADPATATTAGLLRDTVRTLRSVPGQRFRFLFGAQAGQRSEQGYPGDDFVDAIAVDATTSPQVGDALLDGDHGLAWWSTFAAAHAKPFGISRWRPTTGDDPAIVDRVFDWVIDPANRVSFASYDHDPAASRSAERYRVRASALAPLL